MHCNIKILLAASYRLEVYAPAFKKALEMLGVTVVCFDFYKTLYKKKMSPIELRFGFGPTLLIINRQLKQIIKKENPDICLIWNGLGVWPSTIKYIKEKCWVTSYTNDDPFGSRGKKLFWKIFHRGLKYYNSHHVYRDINLLEYQKLGLRNVKIMRSYFVPWLHYTNGKLDNNISEGIISFIGYGEYYRKEVIFRIAEAGLQIKVYGSENSWQSLKNKKNITFYPGILGPKEYREVIWNSTIMIGFLSKENRDDYTRRYFEIPACGGFLIAERTPFSIKLFNEDEEMVFFSSPKEAVKKCRFYLKHINHIKKITKAGLKRCDSSGYDVITCAEQWLNEIQKLR